MTTALAPQTIQVFVFGHPLSDQTKQFLSTLGEVRIHKVLLHVERFCDTLPTVEGVFEQLRDQGADLSGRTPTIFTPPGSSLAAMVLVAAWLGLSGEPPKLLNLIKDPAQSGAWVPSPEAPVLDLHSFRQKLRQQGRKQFHTGVETLSAKVDQAVAAT
jgi:hypothetical protein